MHCGPRGEQRRYRRSIGDVSRRLGEIRRHASTNGESGNVEKVLNRDGLPHQRTVVRTRDEWTADDPPDGFLDGWRGNAHLSGFDEPVGIPVVGGTAMPDLGLQPPTAGGRQRDRHDECTVVAEVAHVEIADGASRRHSPTVLERADCVVADQDAIGTAEDALGTRRE